MTLICDGCRATEPATDRTVTTMREPGVRLEATVHLCGMCTTITSNIAAAVVKRGREWRLPNGSAAPLPSEAPPPAEDTDRVVARAQARTMGFTGNACVSCGSLSMIRNGTCETCTSCGTTSGCG